MVLYYHRKPFRRKHQEEVTVMLNLTAFPTARSLTRNLVQSALPDAPIVPDLDSFGRRQPRRGAVVALHRIADRLHGA
jgi:hypothetical protein